MSKHARLILDSHKLSELILTEVANNVSEMNDTFVASDGTVRVSAFVDGNEFIFHILANDGQHDESKEIITGEDSRCIKVLESLKSKLGGVIITDTESDE